MSLIPVGENIKTIPMHIASDVTVRQINTANGQAWLDFLNGDLEVINDSIVPSDITYLQDNLFRNTIGLTSVNLINVTSIGSYCFYASNLAELALPNLQYAGDYSLASNAFSELHLLELISAGSGLCSYCTNLVIAEFESLNSISFMMFAGCTNLQTLILRNHEMVELSDENAFNGTPLIAGEGYVYVPTNLLLTYRQDENWSQVGVQFRSLNDLN